MIKNIQLDLKYKKKIMRIDEEEYRNTKFYLKIIQPTK